VATAKNLSFAEIQKRIREMDDERAELEAALHAKRGEELKVLADAYAKKLEAAGFTILEGVEALAPYDKSKKTRAKRGTAVPKEAKYVKGAVYRDPEGKGPDYIGGTKGSPKWLRDANKVGEDLSKFLAQSTGKMSVKGGDLVNNG
jgi:hypothetical protein